MPVSDKNLEELIARHEAFLECRPVERPVGRALDRRLLSRGAVSRRHGGLASAGSGSIRPDVRFSPFAADYESLYQSHQAADDDFFYVGSAYWGIPWLEAILGCPVSVVMANCRAEAFLSDPRDFARFGANLLDADLDANPWLAALLRFQEELVRFAGGRFPVCPPLLRGPGDVASGDLGPPWALSPV